MWWIFFPLLMRSQGVKLTYVPMVSLGSIWLKELLSVRDSLSLSVLSFVAILICIFNINICRPICLYSLATKLRANVEIVITHDQSVFKPWIMLTHLIISITDTLANLFLSSKNSFLFLFLVKTNMNMNILCRPICVVCPTSSAIVNHNVITQLARQTGRISSLRIRIHYCGSWKFRILIDSSLNFS